MGGRKPRQPWDYWPAIASIAPTAGPSWSPGIQSADCCLVLLEPTFAGRGLVIYFGCHSPGWVTGASYITEGWGPCVHDFFRRHDGGRGDSACVTSPPLTSRREWVGVQVRPPGAPRKRGKNREREVTWLTVSCTLCIFMPVQFLF